MDFFPTNISYKDTSLPINFLGLTVVDVLTVVVGQPVMAKMLWVTSTSSKSIDILNLNLGIFYNVHHWMCTIHLLLMYLLPRIQEIVLRFIFVYAQTGGPLNLAFISVERYVAVIYPTSYRKLKQYKFREMCAAAVWIISLTIAFISMFFKIAQVYAGFGLLDTLPLIWMVSLTMSVVHNNISIARALRKSRVGNSKLHPGMKKAHKTVIATLYIVLLCYGTMSVLIRVGIHVGREMKELYIIPFSVGFLSAASVAHPVYHLFSKGRLFDCFKHEGKVPDLR